MDDKTGLQVPTLVRLCFDFPQHLLGHAGVMLQSHSLECVVSAEVPDQPDKADHTANIHIAVGQSRQFAADIKIFRLHFDTHRLTPCHWRKDRDFVALRDRSV